ncbi:MAG: Rad52/Rad22 family DNA repair protein [Pseudomonadota bacterium]
MPTNQDRVDLYRRLAAPFPEEAVERTRGDVTRRGYDTTGIKYQYVVNRLNEVLGVGGFRVEREFSVRDKEARSGQQMFDVTCDLVMQLGTWEAGQFLPFAEARGTGGHVSACEADARKGAFTNGLKKCAAMFGCGRQAYEGTLDDDNVPADLRTEEPATGRSRLAEVSPVSAPRGAGSGRITSAQMAKLRELVDQVRGGDWDGFRADVRELHNVDVTYLSRSVASELIGGLIAESRQAPRKRGAA